jgi:peptide chain release factor 2
MEIEKRIQTIRAKLDIDRKKKRLAEVKERLADPSIWQDEDLARELSEEQARLEKTTGDIEEIAELFQIANEGEKLELEKRLLELERLAYFSGKYDQGNAIIQIYSGAGGVDAQDWAEMLMRMYLRYSEQESLVASIIDVTRGSEAGIKNATLEIRGTYSYGKLKGENGVHRLVRLSPFNSKNLRQTSFALIEVIPEISNDSEIKIEEKDLKIDVFRSSGHGGQSVNTTDSAVRITHIPTGITASSQNQRSQLQNKATAMKVVKSRLLELLNRQHKDSIDELRGEQQSNEWGSQIRSYVIHPYKLVKDHRTDYETSNIEAVLGGDLSGFIDSYLKSSG